MSDIIDDVEIVIDHVRLASKTCWRSEHLGRTYLVWNLLGVRVMILLIKIDWETLMICIDVHFRRRSSILN